MRKLDTTPISPAAQFPVKSGTLDHLQDAYQEAINALAQSIIGSNYNAGAVYILFGCVNGAAAPAVNLSAGAVFYNGEVYLVPATNFFLGGGQVAIGNAQLAFNTTNADPVLFTDNVQRSVHQIRTMAISAGASGAGLDLNNNHLPDFSAWQSASIQVNIEGSAVEGAFPNYTINLPANRILYAKNVALGNGDIGSGSNTGYIPGSSTNSFNIAFPDVGTDNYVVMGAVIGAGNPLIDSVCTWSISNKASNGFTITLRDTTGGVQHVSFDFALIASS
jgi:hypothetical protein